MRSQWLADHMQDEWTVIYARQILRMLMIFLVDCQLYSLVTLPNCHLWETVPCIQTNHQDIVQLFMQKAVVCLNLLQLVAVLKARLGIFPFSDEIIENTCNFVNSCSIYIKISASQSLCGYEGDYIFRI